MLGLTLYRVIPGRIGLPLPLVLLIFPLHGVICGYPALPYSVMTG
jgi:hypothetical protein